MIAALERRRMADRITVLVTGAGGSATANVIDALRRAETSYRIVGADVSPVRLHLSDADERCILPGADDDAYEDALSAALRAYGVDVLHPQPDPEVHAIGRIRERLNVSLFLPAQGAIELAADKAAFAVCMDRAGVNVPTSINFTDRESVAVNTRSLLKDHERVWIRARVGAGARASLPVRSAEQALAWIDWWVNERGMRTSDFMGAEMLPGREFAYQSVWQHGALVTGQARERIEYLYGFLTPSGQTSTPAVARTVRDSRVDELAQSAIRALDPSPHGVFCVDIKEDAAGLPKVTEINIGRFFTTSNFFAAAGLNMPDMAMRAACGETLPYIGSSPLESDLYWIRMVDMGYEMVAGADLDRWPRPR
jgi:carbamoyl-phosphate synthase large subunit